MAVSKHACAAMQWRLRPKFHLRPSFVSASREGSDETAQTSRLARAFAARICDKY